MKALEPIEVRERIFLERGIKPETSERCQQKRKKQARDMIERIKEDARINNEFALLT